MGCLGAGPINTPSNMEKPARNRGRPEVPCWLRRTILCATHIVERYFIGGQCRVLFSNSERFVAPLVDNKWSDTSSMYCDDFQKCLGAEIENHVKSNCPYLQSVQEFKNQYNKAVHRRNGSSGRKYGYRGRYAGVIGGSTHVRVASGTGVNQNDSPGTP